MLLSIIRQNQKLAAKRNPAFDRNRFAKFLIYFMVAFWAAYLIFIGVMLSFAFEDIFPSMEPYHIMNQGLIYLLILDFLLRFMLQPAMSQEIKPYLLMPVKKNKLVDTLLLQSGISSYNFFWFFLIIPFALLTIIRFYGLTGILCYLCGIWLLMVMNSYWYLICKTLLNEKLLYILLPIGVYGLLAGTEFIPEGNPVSTFMDQAVHIAAEEALFGLALRGGVEQTQQIVRGRVQDLRQLCHGGGVRGTLSALPFSHGLLSHAQQGSKLRLAHVLLLSALP